MCHFFFTKLSFKSNESLKKTTSISVRLSFKKDCGMCQKLALINQLNVCLNFRNKKDSKLYHKKPVKVHCKINEN